MPDYRMVATFDLTPEGRSLRDIKRRTVGSALKHQREAGGSSGVVIFRADDEESIEEFRKQGWYPGP